MTLRHIKVRLEKMFNVKCARVSVYPRRYSKLIVFYAYNDWLYMFQVKPCHRVGRFKFEGHGLFNVTNHGYSAAKTIKFRNALRLTLWSTHYLTIR